MPFPKDDQDTFRLVVALTPACLSPEEILYHGDPLLRQSTNPRAKRQINQQSFSFIDYCLREAEISLSSIEGLQEPLVVSFPLRGARSLNELGSLPIEFGIK